MAIVSGDILYRLSGDESWAARAAAESVTQRPVAVADAADSSSRYGREERTPRQAAWRAPTSDARSDARMR